MKKSTTISGASLRSALLKSADISQKDVSKWIDKELSQTSRFLAGERECSDQIKGDIYRLFKSKDRKTPITYGKFWSELVEISVGNSYPG